MPADSEIHKIATG